eukprot:2975036-Amphidinium_carterae.1
MSAIPTRAITDVMPQTLLYVTIILCFKSLRSKKGVRSAMFGDLFVHVLSAYCICFEATAIRFYGDLGGWGSSYRITEQQIMRVWLVLQNCFNKTF